MTDPSSPPPGDHPDERIGAWLDGELSADADAAFAAELDADAELAERVEAIRAVRERLAGAHEAPPEGFAGRVREAVDAEAGRDAGAHGEVAAAEPASLAAARSRRRRRMAAVASAAAVLVAVAVVAPLVTDLGPTGDEVAMEAGDGSAARDDAGDTAEAPAGGETDGDEGREEQLEGEALEDGSDDRADSDTGTLSLSGEAPRVVDDGASFDSAAALREHLAERREAVRLVGMGTAQATDLAAHTAAELAAADPFADGSRPDACAADVADRSDGPVVHARVERVRLDGEALTAHLVVTGPPGEPLDRVLAVVVDPAAGCAERLVERLR